MGRIVAACCVAALVSPVYVALVEAEEPLCVETVAPETTTTTLAPEITTTTTVVPEVTTTTTLAPEITTTTTVVPEVTTTTTMVPESTTTMPEEEFVVQSMGDAEDPAPASEPVNPLQPLFNTEPVEQSTTTLAPEITTTTDAPEVTTTTTVVPESTTTMPPTPALETAMTVPPEETMPTTTTTIAEHLDPDCPPIVELLDFPGWGTNDDYFPEVVSISGVDEFDIARASESTTTTTTTVVTPQETPSLQPPTISPANPLEPRVDAVYVVSAQISVTSPVTLEALNDVTMCWVNNDALPEPGDTEPPVASTDCSTLDPRHNFKMVWAEATAAAANGGAGSGTEGFAVAHTDPTKPSQYVNAGSQVETTVDVASYDKSVSVMTIRFAFRVSSAMAQGSNWSVSITAAYDNLATPSTTTTVNTLSVGHWAQIFIGKDPVDFGPVAPNGTRVSPELNLGEYRANGISRLTLQGSNFVCVGDGCSASLSLVTTQPSGGAVLLSCAPKDGSAINVTTGVTPFLQLEPTGEDRVVLPAFSCSLSYGGGASRAMTTYSGPITMNIGPLPTPPTTGG